MNEKRIFGASISERRVRQAEKWVARMRRRYGEPDRSLRMALADSPVLGAIYGTRDVVENRGEHPDPDWSRAVLIGTIRMGYGHYRIAMAFADAARAAGLTPCWFDLLAFDAPAARMIRDMDRWYSLGSRISQRSTLFNRLVWDPLMGKWYRRLERNYPSMALGELIAPLYGDIPRDVPVLASHPFVAHGAAHAGMEHIINIIPDNCPLGFHLSARGVQVVQSPSAYYKFRTLRGMLPPGAPGTGVPPEQLFLAGHYVDVTLLDHLEEDMARRIARINARAPRRLLVSAGGAGAQRDLYETMLWRLMPRVRAGEVLLLFNFGDHHAMAQDLLDAVPGLRELAVIHDHWDETRAFAEHLATSTDPIAGARVFLHAGPREAVCATNLLTRGADLLLTKPSELAYYPIPTLFLPRVGGHEAWGAIRGAELGYGTPECENEDEVARALDLVIREDDLLRLYCDHIPRLARIGVYDGARRVIEHLVLPRRKT